MIRSGPISIHHQQLDYQADSTDLFAKVRSYPYSVFLDSNVATNQSTVASPKQRFDVITAQPDWCIFFREAWCYVKKKSEPGLHALSVSHLQHEKEFSDFLSCLFTEWRQDYSPNTGDQEPTTEHPFTPGMFGFLSYDFNRCLESIPKHKHDELSWPSGMVGFYPWVIVVDHLLKESWWLSLSDELRPEQILATKRTKEAEHSSDQTSHPNQSRGKIADQAYSLESEWASNLTPAEYQHRFDQVKAHINAGDCYQINLAQRFSARYQGDTWAAYQQIREQMPAPFGAYLEMPFGSILSCSPEQFIQIIDGQAETRPIKGTRPRGYSAIADEQAGTELINSAKDRAENLMIVDLLRNDFGKVCKIGTVTTPGLFQLESYSNVHHLTSIVRGELSNQCSALDLLFACFPGGSITGAPKIKAMEIIEALEPNARTIYCGTIFHLGVTGHLHSNITIRTLLQQGNTLYCWGGGGIVADSVCDAEYQETLDKISTILSTF